MATQIAILRLTREYKTIQESPIPFIETHPSARNIRLWPYVITGPPNTPYAGGQYFGYLTFPPNFHYAAPQIIMVTPSGRFLPLIRICTTFTDMHPEAWNPSWTVESILTAFLSYMTGDEFGAGTLHPVNHAAGRDNRPKYAKESKRWNSLVCGRFATDFPELHAANLKSEEFTEEELQQMHATAEARNLSDKLETENGDDTAKTAVSSQEALLDTSYESFVNEDWEKYGSMDPEDGDDEDGEYDNDNDNEMDHEPSDTQMQSEEK